MSDKELIKGYVTLFVFARKFNRKTGIINFVTITLLIDLFIVGIFAVVFVFYMSFCP